MDIYTIGHSTHDAEDFIGMLKAYGIQSLIDVRSYPGSRHMPQFNKESIKERLEAENIRYGHMPELGGRRGKPLSPDDALIGGWTHEAFRNYSAYTLSNEYERGVDKLIEAAGEYRTCIMCAESVPWRCHRLLISNSLIARGLSVYHIVSRTELLKHELNKYGAKAEISGKKVIYPKKA